VSLTLVLVASEGQVRKLQQESARVSEQRDSLRMEVKAAKRREQDAETALAALKLDLKNPRKSADMPAAAAAAAAECASLADRTKQAYKSADETLSKTELARRVPLVGRALGRMERRQALGQLSLAWEAWLQIVDEQAELEDSMRGIGVKFQRIDKRLALVRSLKGWFNHVADMRYFESEVRLLDLNSTIRSLRRQFVRMWIERWVSAIAISKRRIARETRSKRFYLNCMFKGLRKSWHTWRYIVKTKKALQAKCSKLLARFKGPTAKSVLKTWRETCKMTKRLERKTLLVLARWRAGSLSSRWFQWRAYTIKRKIRKRKVAKMALRLRMMAKSRNLQNFMMAAREARQGRRDGLQAQQHSGELCVRIDLSLACSD
jgi:hypothetical protein